MLSVYMNYSVIMMKIEMGVYVFVSVLLMIEKVG